jgi:hypothetical protein
MQSSSEPRPALTFPGVKLSDTAARNPVRRTLVGLVPHLVPQVCRAHAGVPDAQAGMLVGSLPLVVTRRITQQLVAPLALLRA